MQLATNTASFSAGTRLEEDFELLDDLRVLDMNGHRVFELFGLRGLGEPFVYESDARKE